MNQSDFFILYLHLANQKAINNFVITPAFSADLFASLFHHRPTLDLGGKPGVGKGAELKKPNLTKPLYPSFFTQGQKAKKAFALLAFAGLQKTITVTECKTPLGTKGVYNAATLACCFALPQPYFISKVAALAYDQVEWWCKFSLRLKTKGNKAKKANQRQHLLGIKPNSYSVDASLNRASLVSTGKSAKALALVRFKKTLNPCSSKIFEPNVTFSTKLSSNPCFTVRKTSLHFSASSKSFPLLPSCFTVTQRQRENNFLQTARSKAKSMGGHEAFVSEAAKGKLVAKQLVSRQQTAKISGKKVISLFNQRILGQSFKNNFVHHLKSCVSLTEYSGVLATSREDHEIRLTSWAPFFDFQKPGSSSGSKSYEQGVTAAEKQELEKVPTNLNPLSRRLPLLLSNAQLGRKQGLLAIRRSNLASSVRLRQGPLAARPGQPKENNFSQTERSKAKAKSSFIEHEHRKRLKTGTIRFKEGLIDRVKRKNFIYDIPLVKDLFNSAKKENLLTLTALTKFYTASWLLESIRAELSLRNANIKRVLNQTFLLTQQSFIDSSPFTLLRLTKGSKAAGRGNKPPLHNKPLSFIQSVEDATIIPHLIKGLRVSFSGRLGGKKGMAKTLTKTVGRVPLSTLKEKVDFAKGVVNTKAGSLGVKVWICYN